MCTTFQSTDGATNSSPSQVLVVGTRPTVGTEATAVEAMAGAAMATSKGVGATAGEDMAGMEAAVGTVAMEAVGMVATGGVGDMVDTEEVDTEAMVEAEDVMRMVSAVLFWVEPSSVVPWGHLSSSIDCCSRVWQYPLRRPRALPVPAVLPPAPL